jgi:hypothetical protein
VFFGAGCGRTYRTPSGPALHACGFYFYTDPKIMAKSWEFSLHARTNNIN